MMPPACMHDDATCMLRLCAGAWGSVSCKLRQTAARKAWRKGAVGRQADSKRTWPRRLALSTITITAFRTHPAAYPRHGDSHDNDCIAVQPLWPLQAFVGATGAYQLCQHSSLGQGIQVQDSATATNALSLTLRGLSMNTELPRASPTYKNYLGQ
jgi:hypothetical protein